MVATIIFLIEIEKVLWFLRYHIDTVYFLYIFRSIPEYYFAIYCS